MVGEGGAWVVMSGYVRTSQLYEMAFIFERGNDCCSFWREGSSPQPSANVLVQAGDLPPTVTVIDRRSPAHWRGASPAASKTEVSRKKKQMNQDYPSSKKVTFTPQPVGVVPPVGSIYQEAF